MILLRIFSGWSYIGSRLTSRVIEYEESGWYDGDLQAKSPSEQLRDELLYEEKVQPVVERLKLFTLSVASLWVASCIGYNVALSSKPVFDEYDPAVLERLRYDEKLAGVAAEQSAGRPTYCDNRYYRAVANGGQGE
jgi:Conserved in the green lineage and diatoms 27